MRKDIILYILLLATVTGCIKEDLDDCETTLYFSYLGDGIKEIFPQKIDKVDMYVYNQDNVCIQKAVLNKNELNRQRGTTLNLPSGQYHIVCWGNSLNDTRINDGSTLQNSIVGAPHYFTKELISTNDSLYFGERKITIANEGYKTDTVFFGSAHIICHRKWYSNQYDRKIFHRTCHCLFRNLQKDQQRFFTQQKNGH